MTKTFRKTYLAMSTIACLVCSTNIAFAADSDSTNPSSVFQVSGNMLLELGEMNKVNKSKPEDVYVDTTERKPRHVFQKAREIYQDVQKLRGSKGLAQNALAPIPVKDVAPKDVKVLMDKMLADLQELRPKFGYKKPVAATLIEGKKPLDVYANLERVKASIASLGVSKVAPNDVFRVAISVVKDLEEVAAKKGVAPIAKLAPSTGKKPSDVYAASYDLLAQLKTMTEKNKIAIPGGVIMPNKITSDITPAEVIDLVNDVLAEVGAIRHASGINTPTVIPEEQKGKNPSKVYDMIAKAQAIVKTIM